MPELISIPTTQFSNVFDRLNKDWMLITAENGGIVNSMTASWGAFGVLWNHPVAICFIRPQRYTFPLTEHADTLSLSFFDPAWRAALTYMGRNSGRDGDKYAATGLTIKHSPQGIPYPEQANTVLLCRKLYAGRLEETSFIDRALIEANYAEKDYHQMYICKIEQMLRKESPL